MASSYVPRGPTRRDDAAAREVVSVSALFALSGFIDRADIMWSIGGPSDANPLLSKHHYLGPLTAGGHALIVTGSHCGEVVAAQVWRRPSALYRACNWTWAPTWHRLRTPPSGNGQWQPGVVQSVKDRWVFGITPDPVRDDVLHIEDAAAIRHWRENATDAERRWASNHPQLREAS